MKLKGKQKMKQEGKSDLIKSAGINIGHGHVKVQTDDHEYKYASVVAATNMNFESLGWGPKTQRVEVDGKFYEVGEEANSVQSNFDSKVVFSEWAESEVYKVLMQSVIDHLSEEHTGKWTVVLCLPVAHYKNVDYRNMVQDKWFKTHEGRYGQVEVVGVRIFPEALSAMWKYAMEDGANGQKRLSEMERTTVTTLDFGYFTTDWGTMQRMTMVNDKCHSIDYGMFHVLTKMQALLSKRHKIEENLVELEMAMLGKIDIRKGDQIIDIGSIAHEVIAKDGQMLMDQIKTKVGDSNNIMLLAGGTAELYEGLVRENFPVASIRLIEDAQMANAIGCWYLSLSLKELVLQEASAEVA